MDKQPRRLGSGNDPISRGKRKIIIINNNNNNNNNNKSQDRLRDLFKNTKQNNIFIIGVLEGEEREKSSS